MASTYTANQGIEKMDTGDQSGTWGGTVNTNMDIIDRAISGVGALTLTGSTTTLTTTDGTLTDGMYRVLVLGDGGDLGSDNTITLSPNDQDKAYLVYNNLSANRNAIFTQGTGANATVENGETAWIYADGGGSGAIVRTAVSSTKLLDQDGDTGIRVEEGGDDDDTIRFDIAGAEDFTMAANTFTALSGSDIAIASGATITNSGTATGFGADAERAVAGVLEANANFNDQVIFGPSVDGRSWNGAWSKASLFSSLMLCTVETSGSDTQVNIWDLTEQSDGAISTTPLQALTISGVTPRAVDAAMGYIIIATDGGAKMVDPHSGAWVQRTTGWPKSLSTATSPALTNSDIQAVAAGFSDQPAFDPRTGGPMPTFVLQYGTGADIAALVKDDGNLYNRAGTVGNTGVAIWNGRPVTTDNGAANDTRAHNPISTINADDWTASTNIITTNNYPAGFTADNGISVAANKLANASDSGLNILFGVRAGEVAAGGGGDQISIAKITRTVNSGFMTGDVRGAWLANHETADLSAYGNALTKEGTITEAVVETSAELKGYSGWSSSNYLHATAADADFEMGTGAFSYSCWYKTGAVSGSDYLVSYRNASTGATPQWGTYFSSSAIAAGVNDGSQSASVTYTDTSTFDDKWHKHDFTFTGGASTGIADSYIDGVLVATATNASVGSLSGGSGFALTIGESAEAGGYPFGGSISLFRVSRTVPSATQIREMYDAEKPMFVASAECLLQSGSTDAVLDVDVDPLTGKVLVTQTDAITIFDGLAIDSKPTVNSGNSEKGNLWGNLRTEQNTANAYVTAPATDQRQVNEMVRGLASDLPKGVDLSKAKAWILFNGSGTPAASASYNIKSITDEGTGDYTLTFAVPFKSANYSGFVTANVGGSSFNGSGALTASNARIAVETHAGTRTDAALICFVAFGELENE